MKKVDLRKVAYTTWSNSVERNGLFHKFGRSYNNDIGDIVSVAIVENAETGAVELSQPDNIRFVDNWPTETDEDKF